MSFNMLTNGKTSENKTIIADTGLQTFRIWLKGPIKVPDLIPYFCVDVMYWTRVSGRVYFEGFNCFPQQPVAFEICHSPH